MKKLIIISVLIFFNFLIGSAQSLNYSETAKYISSKLETFNQQSVDYKCDISQYGLITEQFKTFGGKGAMVKNTVNINDISKIELVKSLVASDQYFIYFYCKSGKCANVLGYSTSVFHILFTSTELDAQRLHKAFLHLQNLAKNTKDPFDCKHPA